MDNKYGTKVQILHQMGQDIVGSNESILKIEKMIFASGCKNLVFTNTALADCFKQRLKGFTVNVIEYYKQILPLKVPSQLDYIQYNKGKPMVKFIKDNFSKDEVCVIMNPPFDGDLHLKLFNQMKKYANNIICIHPSTQLEALPTYCNGKNEDFNTYIKDGLYEQEIFPFNVFSNTDAYGDIVLDYYRAGSNGKTMKYNTWAYRENCKDKELYPIVYDAIQKYLNNGINSSLDKVVVPFSKHSSKNWNVYVRNIQGKGRYRAGSTPLDGTALLISTNHLLPYNSQGYNDKEEFICDNYCHSTSKALKHWNTDGFTSVQFNDRRDADKFIEAWSQPGVSVILNCVTHDQHPKYQLVPCILEGDIIKELGLDAYRQRMIEEEQHYTIHKKEKQLVEDTEVEEFLE